MEFERALCRLFMIHNEYRAQSVQYLILNKGRR